MTLEKALKYIKEYKKPVKIMEVCGTHTAAIMRNGIKSLIPENIRLVSGPGCPVCVTGLNYLDRLAEISERENNIVLAFGDILRLKKLKRFKMIYSPLEAAELAEKNPQCEYTVAAVGFETTAPIYAVLIDTLIKNNINNVKLLTSLKTMPAALRYICKSESIDGFICPGHVSAVTGTGIYAELAGEYHKPFVVAGFEAEHIIAAIYRVITQIEKNMGVCENLYKNVVREKGNGKALSLIEKYFSPCAGYWRGIGEINDSALVLRKEYCMFDAGSVDLADLKDDCNESGCMCGDVMLGRISPAECSLFGICSPRSPVGACMVSSEGACNIYYTWVR